MESQPTKNKISYFFYTFSINPYYVGFEYIAINISCIELKYFFLFQVTRLISLAAQKFISDISYEALQHCKMRGGGKDLKSKGSGRDRKYAMATEDIIVALSDQGVSVKKPPYYAN